MQEEKEIIPESVDQPAADQESVSSQEIQPNDTFEMVAKTFQGLEEVLAEELRGIGAINVEPGRRMVSFEGNLATLYKANLCCRTALRILKPFFKFEAHDTEELYEMVKEYDWEQLLSIDKSFSIDVTAYSDEFSHSRYATYRIKDAIVDYFRDRYNDKRPNVCVQGADVQINAYITGSRVTLSLDSSGESLHKRGYRVAQTDAPINEVLAAGIILRSGWRGDCPLVDPMCGSGTFLIEAALIAANINPGVYRQNYAFEQWPDFDKELFESLYNDDSQEREVAIKIYGADISPKAIAIAQANIKSAGVGRYIDLELKALSQWEEAPAGGVLVTNPPYGERISVDDMDGLYALLGSKLKHVFKGYHAWIIGYRDEYFQRIGLTPSVKIPMFNGALDCELREYEIFDGDYKSFRAAGGQLHGKNAERERGGERGGGRGREPRSDRRSPRPDNRTDRTDRRDFKKRFDSDRERFATRDDRQRARRERFTASGPERRDGDLKEWWNDRMKSKERRDSRPDDRGPRQPRRDSRPGMRDQRPASREPRRDFRDSGPRDIAFTQEAHDENPLAMRRNVNALRSIQGKKPSLQGPLMRGRRGWKRPDSDNPTPQGE